MLASSRVPDVDVYAEVAALKRSHVYHSVLSSLDVNETTIPLIQVLKRAYNVIPSSTTHMPAMTGPLGLMEAEEVYV